MELIGKSFKVTGTYGFATIIDVVGADSDGLFIQMTSTTQWGTRESSEYLSLELFESCLRTGYLAESA